MSIHSVHEHIPDVESIRVLSHGVRTKRTVSLRAG